MGDGRWIFWLVGIFVLMRLSPALLMIPALLRMRLQRFRASVAEATDLDPAAIAWLRKTAEPLVALGFREAGFAEVRDLLDAGADPEVRLYLRHAETGSFAQIMPNQLPDYRLPWRIDLDTPLSDGRTLSTLNALEHAVIDTPPETVVHNVSCMTERELWEAHRRRLGELAAPRHQDFEAFLRRTEAQNDRLLRFLEERRVIRRDQPGERFRLRLPAALRLAWKMGMGNATRERFLNRRSREIAAGRLPAEQVEVWHEVAAYLRAQRATRNPIRPSHLVALFAGSGAAFVLAMSWIFGAVGVLCLLAVVAFHELGHYAAMRTFGYRDTSIFFVPFLGAATTGKKADASLSQEVIVFLAGPLPGIALGAALALTWTDLLGSQWGLELVAMLIAINLLNLLPVVPLDGGRIVELVLLAGRPRAALLVGATGVGGFAWLAVSVSDPILLAFCALFALNLRSHYRGMRFLERVRAGAPSAGTERERATATFALLAAEPPQSFGRKVGLARLVERHWVPARGGRLVRLAWLAAYLAILCVCVGAAALAFTATRSEPDAEAIPAGWLDPTGAPPPERLRP